MLCKYFPPNLTYVTALPCETHMLSIAIWRWNVCNKLSDDWISIQ